MKANLFLLTCLIMPFLRWCIYQLCPSEATRKLGFVVPGNRSCVTTIMVEMEDEDHGEVAYVRLARDCMANYSNGRLISWNKLWPYKAYGQKLTYFSGAFLYQNLIALGIWLEEIKLSGKDSRNSTAEMKVNYVTGETFTCKYAISAIGSDVQLVPTPYKLSCDIFWEGRGGEYYKNLTNSQKGRKYCLYRAIDGEDTWAFGAIFFQECSIKPAHYVYGYCAHDKGKFSQARYYEILRQKLFFGLRCAHNYVLPFCQHTDVHSCEGHPCAEGATCVNYTKETGRRSCNCSFGHDDLKCYRPPKLNPCHSNPCGLFGACKELNDKEYHCECRDGSTGPYCLEVTKACSKSTVEDVCIPNAECLRFRHYNLCRCGHGLADRRCYKTTPCLSNPCGRNAICEETGDDYVCNCDGVVKKERCTEVDPLCHDHACVPNAECIPAKHSHVCSCEHGMSHRRCYVEAKLPCKSSPCGEHGKCVVRYSPLKWECQCNAGKTGILCTEDLNECSSNPCYGNSSCVNGDNQFKCVCAEGYTGRLCNQNIDDCAENPCQNGGTCYDDVADYFCRCKPGYTGKSCEKDIDECESSPCKNGGTCHNKMDRFECTCAAPFKQPICSDKDVTACDPNPCRNGGTCQIGAGIGNYTCTCRDGFFGPICQFEVLRCSQWSCNHGQCKQGARDYECICEPGYVGKVCNEEIDECLIEGCENNGTCQDEVNGISCTCPEFFTGSRCQEEVDECQEDQCANNGTCFKHTGVCSCQPGHTGTYCEISLDTEKHFDTSSFKTILLIGVTSTVAFVGLMALLCSLLGPKKPPSGRYHSRSRRRIPLKIRRDVVKLKTYPIEVEKADGRWNTAESSKRKQALRRTGKLLYGSQTANNGSQDFCQSRIPLTSSPRVKDISLLCRDTLPCGRKKRFNFGRAAARAHFDELNLLQLPRNVGMTFDCCAALEPPTMWIAPKRDDAANIDVPDLEKEEPPLGGGKSCTCKDHHAHKQKAPTAEPPVSEGRTAIIINEPKCFPEQTEEQRRAFERKRDAHYANEAIIAQKIMRNEMTPEEAQQMLGITNPWAEEEKKKKQPKKSGKKKSQKKKSSKKKRKPEKEDSS